MTGICLTVAIATALPLGVEIDLSPLPPANTTAGYRLKITLVTANRTLILDKHPGPAADPPGVLLGIVHSLRFGGWTYFQSGNDRVIVYGWQGAPVTRVDIQAEVPKPIVRPVPK